MDHIAALVADLISTLDRQQACVEALLDLLEEERQAIRALSLQNLTACTAAKLSQLENIRALEAQRAAVVVQLAAQWGTDPGGLTLDAVAARAPAETAERLLRRRDRLRASVLTALDACHLNGSIITRVRTGLERTLSCWRPVSSPSDLYSQSGLLCAPWANAWMVERKG